MDGEPARAPSDVLEQVRQLTAAEEGPLAAARARAVQALSVPAPEVGALLRWAAAQTGARAAVEVGAAGGVTALWLLRGMTERGVVTSIEHDPHHHALATQAYEEAGASGRVRSILGEPTTVLGRLSDHGYDVCVLQGRATDYPQHLDHAVRLLRPGGVLIARNVLVSGDAAEALATFTTRIGEDEGLVGAVLPVDGGVAVATVR